MKIHQAFPVKSVKMFGKKNISQRKRNKEKNGIHQIEGEGARRRNKEASFLTGIEKVSHYYQQPVLLLSERRVVSG